MQVARNARDLMLQRGLYRLPLLAAASFEATSHHSMIAGMITTASRVNALDGDDAGGTDLDAHVPNAPCPFCGRYRC